MSDNQIPDDSFINSIIGEGTKFNGDFELNGLLRIDGDFCGTVRTNGKVLIGKNGRVECTVYAGTVVIGGIVRGQICANEKVIILSTGIMLGDISTPRFIVEEGVIFNGNCKIMREGQETRTPAPVASQEREHKTALEEAVSTQPQDCTSQSPLEDKKPVPAQ